MLLCKTTPMAIMAALAILTGCVTGQTPAPQSIASTPAVATEAPPSRMPVATAASAATHEPTAEPTLAAEATAEPISAPTAEPTPKSTTEPRVAVPPTPPEPDRLRLTLKPFVEGLEQPVLVTHAGDGSGRLFIVEKTGAVRLVVGGQLLAQPFLNVSDRIVSSGSEQGLLGLAFPPDYASRKFFFLDYIDKNGHTVVARYQVTEDPNLADPGSEFKVIGLDQPAANHNGGNIVFGPDGYLWIGTGDGGAANDRFGNGQNGGTLLAKMLRLDVTSDLSQPHTIPADNPWVSSDWNGQTVRDEVWAVGLRNPWRYSFDRGTGDLWIADVGQNKIEEVNVVRAGSEGGLNFGWPIMEGLDCFQAANCVEAGLELPVATYSHGSDGCSVTGGYVYRGAQIPALLGVYVYGDFCSGRIWGLNAANPGAPDLLMETGLSLSSFGEDEAGELYLSDLGRGEVQRITVE